MFTVGNTDARQQRARRKAEEVSPEVIDAGEFKYLVEGSQGDYYDVTVHGANVACNCLAGQNHNPCYHGFAALARHSERAAFKPAPAPRDRRLEVVESDLRFIGRRAEEMSGDFETSEAIGRAVRAALASLSQYELELTPGAADVAAWEGVKRYG